MIENTKSVRKFLKLQHDNLDVVYYMYKYISSYYIISFICYFIMGNKIKKKKRNINKQKRNEEMFGPKWPIHLQPSIVDLMVVIVIPGYIICCIPRPNPNSSAGRSALSLSSAVHLSLSLSFSLSRSRRRRWCWQRGRRLC